MEQGQESGSSNSRQMTIDDALKVMWLRNNPEFYKLLGTLLDEGYLHRGRLEWAARTAYEPIKQAAAVILDSLKQSEERKAETSRPPGQAVAPQLSIVNVDISMEEAQNTIWPLPLPPNCKGQPMGPLVNSRQLGLKDLAYAIEKAWDKRVKQASIVFILQQLNQTLNEPPPSAGPLRTFSRGRSFAERKQLQLSLLLGMISGAIIFAPVFLFYGLFFSNMNRVNSKLTEVMKDVLSFLFRNFELPQTTVAVKIAAWTVLVIIALAPAVLFVWLVVRIVDYISKRMWENINKYRKGQEGEEKVAETMVANLDGEWSLFRNISLSGSNKTDLDLVLIGPPGVWVLEVKNLDGQYKNIGEDWKYRSGNDLKPLRKSPSAQAKNSAVRLAEFLKADGIAQWVNPVVVWANEESHLAIENPTVPVWLYNRMPEELGNIWQSQPMEKSQQERIETKLMKLCEKKD